MAMEAETRRFYKEAANHAPSEEAQTLPTDLAGAEEDHQDLLAAQAKEKKESGMLGSEGASTGGF
jgi:rubrerythrin